MLTVTLKKGHDKRLQKGHLWIFSNELAEIPQFSPGSLAEVKDFYGTSYGLGFYHPNSLISVRLLLTDQEINTSFFTERIKTAYNLRQKIYPGEEIYRLVFGESDFLPGLLIDKYGDYFSVQILSAGMEMRKQMLFESLIEVFPSTRGIIEKNNSNTRLNEGLPLFESIVFGEIPDEILTFEDKIKLSISLEGAQKTGYFLDQRENRKFLRSISSGLNVLDCYCNQGGFALYAAVGGAATVTAIDSSETALNSAEKSARLNSAGINFIRADVVDFLEKCIKGNKDFDIIILDPPAFAKTKKSVPAAINAYSKINRLALKLINRGGFLATSSCSHHLDEDVFYNIVLKGAEKQRRRLKLIFRGMQSHDHPVLAAMPETRYLKFFAFEVF